MKKLLIHGLGASELSFTYLANNLSDCTTLSYNSLQALQRSIKDLEQHITEPCHLIGHSLGGIIALHLALNNQNVKSVTTIAAPHLGSKVARFLKYVVVGAPVFADVTPNSWFIRHIKEQQPECPVLSIVAASGGWSIFGEPNDGTIELSSQRGLTYGKKVEVHANHTEVLHSRQTLNAIREFYEPSRA